MWESFKAFGDYFHLPAFIGAFVGAFAAKLTVNKQEAARWRWVKDKILAIIGHLKLANGTGMPGTPSPLDEITNPGRRD